MKKTMYVAVATTAVALAFEPTAAADQYDYISNLDTKGLYYSDMMSSTRGSGCAA